jgi:hypothetical protein
MILLKRFGISVMFLLIIFLIISTNNSFATSCAFSLEPKELFKRNDSVFVGKVIELSSEKVGTLNPKSRATFAVQSILKGRVNKTITIVTSVGMEFVKGNDYLVYAYKTTKENYLYKYEEGEYATDTVCGGTKELSLAGNDLKQLSKGEKINSFLIAFISLVIITSIIILIRRRIENKIK